MADLIKNLRSAAEMHSENINGTVAAKNTLYGQAADEIERLEREITRLEEKCEDEYGRGRIDGYDDGRYDERIYGWKDD